MGSGAFITLLLLGQPSLAGADFVADARLIERLAACTGTTAVPASIDASELLAYCDKMKGALDWYRESYVEPARGFITEREPPDLPSMVLYPFGAGDLFAALTTYPGAKEVTTISIVRSGDPRRVRALGGRRLSSSLARSNEMVKGLLGWSDAKSLAEARAFGASDFPTALTLSLIALAVHGYEPVALRYFVLEDDGGIRYLDQAAIEALEHPSGKKRGAAVWTSPDQTTAFASSELLFVKRGEDPSAVEPRVYRHISTSLSDDRLSKDPSILRHLEQKGRVVALTKGSGYVLWQRSFSMLRDYLLKNVDFMVSDSTGLPPSIAYPAGFVAETFGHFRGAPFSVNREYEKELRALWSRDSTKALIFRYGHLDNAQNYHLMLLRRSTPEMLVSFPKPSSNSAEEHVDVAEKVDGARHWRLWTKEGGVHVWTPPHYRAASAGLVLYVHGYYVSVDEAWIEHHLADQFRASGKNALFVVPEAASCDHEAPVWPNLKELVEAVTAMTKVQMPKGPWIALAHSGGFRTVASWLDSPELKDVVLLDGFYGYKQDRFRDWLTADQGHEEHRLVLTSTQTADRSAALSKVVRGSVTLPQIPEDPKEVPKPARKAPLLYMPSQYEHMELVTGGRVIPLVLQLSRLSDR